MVSQHCVESFFHEIRCNGKTSFMEFMRRRLDRIETGEGPDGLSGDEADDATR